MICGSYQMYGNKFLVLYEYMQIKNIDAPFIGMSSINHSLLTVDIM